MNTENPATARPGVDVPDTRGRVGLDRTGRNLTRNARVKILGITVLASDWHVMRKTTYEYTRRDGSRSIGHRETYDRGNGTAVLLHNLEHRTVLLVRQFRYPAHVNEHPDGMLLEAPAGLLDDDDPVTAIRREAEEETGGGVDGNLRRCGIEYWQHARHVGSRAGVATGSGFMSPRG